MPKSNYNKLESYRDLPCELEERAENALISERQVAIRKSNKLIRDFTANMTTSQFRLANYIIGIAYTQNEDLEVEFNIKRYCEICGIDYKSGYNYKQIKTDVKKLADRSLWVETFNDPNCSVLVRLINKFWIYRNSGIVKIRLDEDVKQYISALAEQYNAYGRLYTSYAFLYTLPMRSVYSMRLYELLKSWADAEWSEDDGHYWTIEHLQQLLGVDYKRYIDFRRFVIDKAVEEINEYTDLNIAIEPIREGRVYKYINFIIQPKTDQAIIKIQNELNKYLDFEKDIERAKRRAAKSSLPANANDQTTFAGCEDMPEPPLPDEHKSKKPGRPRKK